MTNSRADTWYQATVKCCARSATLPGRPVCDCCGYGRSSPISLCSLRGPPGALDSDVYWPAQLCCVWLQDLEPTTNGPSITRTVALFIRAPAQDALVCSSTRQCWLQLWVSCTVVWRCCDCTASSAPTTNVHTRLNSTQLLCPACLFISLRINGLTDWLTDWLID